MSEQQYQIRKSFRPGQRVGEVIGFDEVSKMRNSAELLRMGYLEALPPTAAVAPGSVAVPASTIVPSTTIVPAASVTIPQTTVGDFDLDTI